MCGLLACVLALLWCPSSASAEWEDVGASTKQCFVSKANSSFTASDVKVPNSMPDLYPSGASGTMVFYKVTQLAGSSVVANEEFRINVTSSAMSYSYGSSVTTATDKITKFGTNIRYFAAENNTFTEIYPNDNGYFVTGFVPQYVAVSVQFTGLPNLYNYETNGYLSMYTTPNYGVLRSIPDPTLEDVVQDQTNELTDTSGSGSVVDDVLSQGTDIVEGVDFVGQTSSFISQSVGVFADAEPSGTVRFPGISLMGFTIPAQDVSVLEGLDPDILELIRTGTTLVLFLAWVNGLISMYHKIFLGVEVVESEE